MDHEIHMRRALQEAASAMAAGDLPIGAVVVHNSIVVAAGRNAVDSQRDDTHHAELIAIRAIAKFLFEHKRECGIHNIGAVHDVSRCNCQCRHSRVVYGVRDAWVGAENLLAHGEYYKLKELQFIPGVLEAESQALLNEYVRRRSIRAHLSTEGG